MTKFVADEFEEIRKRRDEIVSEGYSVESAETVSLDKIGALYNIYRQAVESDYEFRQRIIRRITGG